MLSQEELNLRHRFKTDFPLYSSRCLKIRTKEGAVKPFNLNQAQKFIHQRVERQRLEKGYVRALILKGRQQGCSTYVGGRFYWRVTHEFGYQVFILTHLDKATQNLFDMTKRFHESCPSVLKPMATRDNANELVFSGLSGAYQIATAKNKSTGRGSTIQLFHGSEVAYWQNAEEHAKGALQAVPLMAGTEIFLESTANGMGNYFFEQWQLAMSGDSGFEAIFVPWFWQSEYRIFNDEKIELDDYESELVELYGLDEAQLKWRRYKVIELKTGGRDGAMAFRQEYPCNATEAFEGNENEALIDSGVVMRAMKEKIGNQENAPLIVGVDPAGKGKSGGRTGIIRRRGRLAYGLEYVKDADDMQVCGIVARIIQDEQPDAVFIDLGWGHGVHDRLIELGYGDVVIGVSFGGGSVKEINGHRIYANKRAEMWGEMNEWLQETPCQIPHDDRLLVDICTPRIKKPTSSGAMQLESKDDMKKRGAASPDGGDALALTFAEPVRKKDVYAKHQKAASLMNRFKRIDNLRRAQQWK
jgi:hypothetical protein